MKQIRRSVVYMALVASALFVHFLALADTKQNGDKNQPVDYRIVENALQGMSLEEKVGQMMMPDFRKWKDKDVTEMLPEIEQLVKRHHIGGVILFRENTVTTEQTVKLTHAYQDAAEKYGLFIAIDQEGGSVTRLQSGTAMPGNMALGAARSAELAEQVGRVIGSELAALGFNMNFAPVLDVNNNPDNPVIGVRSFGENPQLVADLGIAYLNGLQRSNIVATAKHFPGHGDTDVDSHLGLPEVAHDKTRLHQVELHPFKQAINSGVDALMTAHVTFPEVDDTRVISRKDGKPIALPATLSPKVITGLIRGELGFEGVVTTDAMNMLAIADPFGPVDAAVRAIQAGVDVILMPMDLADVTDGVLKAVQTGQITEERINQSVRRIIALKVKRGIVKAEEPTEVQTLIHHAGQIVGSLAHRQVEAKAAARSVTLVKNKNGILPLSLADRKKIIVIGTSYTEELAQAILAHHADTVTLKLTEPGLTPEQWAQLDEADIIIMGSYSSNRQTRLSTTRTMRMYNEIIRKYDKPVIAVAIRNPYDIMGYPEADAYLAQYGFGAASFAATAAILFGKAAPVGKLPVTIPAEKGGTLYPYGTGLYYSP